MSLSYQNGHARIDSLGVSELAETYGTPLYVYSGEMIEERLQALTKAFPAPHYQAYYAVKTNSNLSILRKIFQSGLGADVVSLGELERALIAGAQPGKIMFSGVGKRDDEIERAIQLELKSINIESKAEFLRVSEIAKKLGRPARIAFRVNPNIDAETHPKISTGLFSSKFGIVEDDVRDILYKAKNSKHLNVVGLTCHIGSQITSVQPYLDAAKRMKFLMNAAKDIGHRLEFVDMGGGFGIRYLDEILPAFSEFAQSMRDGLEDDAIQIAIEPGRSVVGEAGYLLTKALYKKSTPEKNFLIVDAAMNDLLRPTLYDAYHEIVSESDASAKKLVFDVVGPICETGDVLGQARLLPYGHESGLYLIKNCGAYAAAMGSQYNSRPRPAEVYVSKGSAKLIRRRESLDEIWQIERETLVEDL